MPITFIPLPNSLPFPIIQKYEAKNVEGEIIHKFAIKRHVDKEKQTEFDITFRSKVISRVHAELIYGSLKLCNGADDYGWMIKDLGSSSGTFVNGKRLSAANTPSNYFQLKHQDQLQLGVDYQQRHEDIYKSVKCKIELNQEYPLLNHTRYQELNLLIKKLYSITHQTPVHDVLQSIQQPGSEDHATMDLNDLPSDIEIDLPPSPIDSNSDKKKRPNTLVHGDKMDIDTTPVTDSLQEDTGDIQTQESKVPPLPIFTDLPLASASKSQSAEMSLPECCICLMPLKLYHGLFISPCCHLFHYHCVRQLCVGHFLCPMFF
eukprot:NODE_288_length_11703_cov_0.386591.p3 type:complete len:318 gc:universal NODE_288_length_11703_cov_0.386591:7741-6788(-)